MDSIERPQAGVTAYRWYVLAVLTGAQACHSIDRLVVSVVMEPLRHEFHLSDTQLGLLSGLIYGITYGLAAVPMGMLVDRVVRRRFLAIILTIWSGMTMVCGFATGFLTLLASRAAVGFAEAGGSPTGMSLLSDYFPPRERSTAVGLWYLSSAVSTIVTFFGGAYIAATYGWRAAFFMAGVPGLVMAFLIFFTVREPARGGVDEIRPMGGAVEAAPSPRQSFALIAAQPAVVHLILGVVLTSAAISSYASWSISFFVRDHGMPLARAGLSVALTLGVFGAVGSLLFGMFADRLTKRDAGGVPWRSGIIAAATSFLSLIFGILSLLVPSTPVALGFVIVYALFFTSYNGPANGLLLTILPSRVRGFAIGLLQLGATLIGYGVGPFIVGWMSTTIGGTGSLRWALATILLCHFWAGLHFALAGLHVRQSAARLAASPMSMA